MKPASTAPAAPSVYTFPFSTCESRIVLYNGMVSQPYSASINLLVVLGLLYLWIYFRPNLSAGLVLSLILFEGWHMLSHLVYIPQYPLYAMYVIHLLAYLIAFQWWITIQRLRKDTSPPNDTWKVYVLLAYILIDIWIWFYVKGHWSVISGTGLIFLVGILYYSSFPPEIRRLALGVFVPLSFLGILLFFIEHYYCDSMMRYMRFPYHIGVELVVGAFILTLAYLMISWEKSQSI